MESTPPNAEQKDVRQVTSATATRRKSSLGKQFRHTFIGGDAKTAWQYMVAGVIVPMAKEMIVEAMSSGFERLIYGDTGRRHRTGNNPMAHVVGRIQYNQASQQARSAPPTMTGGPTMSRAARSRFDFDEIVISSRPDAEEVLSQMYEIVSRFGEVTVADFYSMVGVKAEHTDHKWGWRALPGASVGRVRNAGYFLSLPEPEHLG